MLLQAGQKNNSNSNNQFLNEDLWEAYIFQYTDSENKRQIELQSAQELDIPPHISTYEIFHNQSDMKNYQMHQYDGINYANKDQHYDGQINNSEQFTFYSQKFQDNTIDFNKNLKQDEKSFQEGLANYQCLVNNQQYYDIQNAQQQNSHQQQINNAYQNNKFPKQFNNDVTYHNKINNRQYLYDQITSQDEMNDKQNWHEINSNNYAKDDEQTQYNDAKYIQKKKESFSQNPQKIELSQNSILEAAKYPNFVNSINNHTKIEYILEDIHSQQTLPTSNNYYQILHDMEKQQQDGEEKFNIQRQDDYLDVLVEENNNIPEIKSEEYDLAFKQIFDSNLPNSNARMNIFQSFEQGLINQVEVKYDNNNEKQENFHLPKHQIIKNSNKKNVVKNIMSAFKNFILEPIQNNYNINDIDVVLELYNKTKQGVDDLPEMQQKFKRYITSKNFNHYTVKLLIQHQNYSDVFKYFLNGPIKEWIQISKVSDIPSHQIMIDFLKECFEDINLIDLLKGHEKKKAHYQ